MCPGRLMLGVLRSATEIGWRLVCLSMCNGRKVFSFGCWGTWGWMETVDEMPQGMGTGGETKVRLQVTGLQNFCPASPFLSLLGKKKKIHYL